MHSEHKGDESAGPGRTGRPEQEFEQDDGGQEMDRDIGQMVDARLHPE